MEEGVFYETMAKIFFVFRNFDHLDIHLDIPDDS